MQQDQTIVEVVNRTTKPLNFMFDGVPGHILPGYRLDPKGKPLPAGRDGYPQTTSLTKVAAEYARRQNVKLGTEDRYSGEAQFLVGVAERGEDGLMTANPHWLFNDISYTEQGEAIERFDRSTMEPSGQHATTVKTTGYPRGRSGTSEAPLAYNDGPVPMKG